MRQVIVVAGLLGGLLGLSACNQPVAADSSAASIKDAPTVAAKWNAENACSLLDTKTVGAALGMEIVKAEAGSAVQRTHQTAGVSTCYYDLADGQRVAFMARQSPQADNSPEAMQRTRQEMAAQMGPVQDVSGVGKGAFWVPKLRQLVVFLGEDRYFNLTMPEKLDGKDPKTLALGLATRVS